MACLISSSLAAVLAVGVGAGASSCLADRAAKRDFDLGIDVAAPFCALDYPLFLTDATVFDL